MSKKRVYKIGDIVRIIDPKFVTRVGYPWTKQYVKENIITAEQKRSIEKLIEGYEEKPQDDNLRIINLSSDSQTYDKILDALAFKVLSEKRFGGRERSIHTFTEEKAKNLLAMIIGKRVVRTGVYIPTTMYGEMDVDPAYLGKSKTHVLLEVDVFTDDSFVLREQIEWGNKFEDIYTSKIEIEECNVEIAELTETQKKNQKTIASWQDIKL